MPQHTDHFDNALQESHPPHDHGGDEPEHPEYEDVELEETDRKGWRPSQNMVVGFLIMLGAAGFFGYKKLNKSEVGGGGYDQVDVSALPAEGNAGMMTPASPPAPTSTPAQTQQAPAPAAPLVPASPSEPQMAPAPMDTASLAGQQGNAVPDQAQTTAANQQQAAQQNQRVSDLESEVANLKATVAKLSAAQPAAPVKVTAKPAARQSVKASSKDKAQKREEREAEQVGYRIRQIVPGQGWVETDGGKLFVVGVGDKIGGAEVLAIDADKYRITTTAGVIK
ncbi:hypothetical protein ACTOWA_00780 [Herbaspirillum seropedicae]|uniref:hypothetical protein n=1 Tax=Herbaspirillum seropedicae TaxID=964 RepID=UPI0028597D3E|nr:hypothetical protein [Herbaspirillum seropedicae]MDR6398045.1 hypothetical protein [Herbaspirillum seropedicae]